MYPGREAERPRFDPAQGHFRTADLIGERLPAQVQGAALPSKPDPKGKYSIF